MRRLSVVLLLAAYQVNETSCNPTRKSRDLSESNEDLSSDVDHPISSRITRDADIRRPSDANEMMDTAETHIFLPAFTVIENQKKRDRRKKQKTYLLVNVVKVDDVPIVIDAQVVPNGNYLTNYDGIGGFGGFRRK